MILGFHADVDAKALGIGVQAFFLVELDGAEWAMQFEEATSGIPEVIGMYQLSGPHDYQVHVVARDGTHLRALALETFPGLPGVARLETALVFGYRARSLPDLLNDAE